MTNRSQARAYWCDQCQVPVLGPLCHCCGGKTRNVSSATFSPVFRPEIAFLKKITAPHIARSLQEGATWTNYTNYQYFTHGKPVLKLRNNKEGSDAWGWKCTENTSILKKKPRKEIIQDLRRANGPYVEEMQYEAEKFILETVAKYQGRTLIVSFSGGKDSTVVSHLVMNALGRPDILHMFADTTIEFPDTYRYIEDFQRRHPLTPFVVVRSSLDFFKTAKAIGPPSRILRWCCSTHKTNPLAKFINSISPDKGVLTFDGIRKSESSRRSDYPRLSNQHKIKRETLARPILHWSDFQIWLFILYHELNFNFAYRKGFRRVGCLYCPFNSDWSFSLMPSNYYQKMEKWKKFLMMQAKNMNHPNCEAFIKFGWRVRAGGRGLDHYKTSIESAPCKLSDTAISYQILSGDIKRVRHFLRPFGPQSIMKQNGFSEAFIIHDAQSQAMLASVEVGYEDKVVRVNYYLPKNRRLFQQRVEKQLKKLQTCIACGACSAKCSSDSISYDDGFTVDSSKCIGCLECVSHICPVVRSLYFKGSKINGRI